MKKHMMLVGGLIGAVGAAANGSIVRVEANGVVNFNVLDGNQAGVLPGAPVVMRFDAESNTFVNGDGFATRGYPIDAGSFSMTVGGAPVLLANPQPLGPTSYFVLRNNDRAGDGFVLLTSVPGGLPPVVKIPGVATEYLMDFAWTFESDKTLSSLDILDAVGSYEKASLGAFSHWAIHQGGFTDSAEYMFQTITLTKIPAPAGLAVFAMPLLALRRRSV